MNRQLLLRWSFWIAVVLAPSFSAAGAEAALSDCIDATCRITAPDGGRGTGCVFAIADEKVYVLTNAHVATGRTLQLEFWRNGHQSRPIAGRTIMRNEAADAAVVLVDAVMFGGQLPTAVPIARTGHRLRPGETITSVGCAHGSWSTGWKGHALGYGNGDLHFRPTPANGRSGSAIFDATGSKIVGLLRARFEGDGAQQPYGIATSVETLWQRIGEHNAQCPGGVCPAPDLPPNPWRLSPYRHQQDERNRQQDERIGRIESLYPTMPRQQPQAAPMVPVNPPIDFSPISQRLDRLGDGQDKIAELLVEIRRQNAVSTGPEPAGREAAAPAQPPAPRHDATALQAAEEAKIEAAAAKAQAEASRQESSRLREAVDTLIGDRETLKQRFNERIEKVKSELGEDAGRREIGRAYVKDLAAEKLSGAGGWTIGKLLGGALGLSGPLAIAVAAGAWFISRRFGRRLDSDDPLLIHRVMDRLGDKLDALKDRLPDQPTTTTRRKASR